MLVLALGWQLDILKVAWNLNSKINKILPKQVFLSNMTDLQFPQRHILKRNCLPNIRSECKKFRFPTAVSEINKYDIFEF